MKHLSKFNYARVANFYSILLDQLEYFVRFFTANSALHFSPEIVKIFRNFFLANMDLNPTCSNTGVNSFCLLLGFADRFVCRNSKRIPVSLTMKKKSLIGF